MSEHEEKSTTALLKYLGRREPHIADILVERWALLRSENQTQHKAQLQAQGELISAIAMGVEDILPWGHKSRRGIRKALNRMAVLETSRDTPFLTVKEKRDGEQKSKNQI